jgi:hypothetical protein
VVIVLISLVWNLVVPNAGFGLETEVTQSPAGWLPQSNCGSQPAGDGFNA